MQVKQAQEHGDFPSTGEQSELIRKKVLLLEYKQLQGLRDLISRNLVPTGLKLGQGSSGKVTIEKVEFAVKKPHDGTNLKHEKEILFSLNHSNILTFVSYTRGPPEKLITELMMGNLREFINYKANNLRIDTIIHFASDLAHGLDYLHGNGYLHDDFKASNMLISLRPDIAKIGDFSLAKKMSPSNPETRDYLHYDHQRYKVAAVFPETFKVSRVFFIPAFFPSSFVTSLLELSLAVMHFFFFSRRERKSECLIQFSHKMPATLPPPHPPQPHF